MKKKKKELKPAENLETSYQGRLKPEILTVRLDTAQKINKLFVA